MATRSIRMYRQRQQQQLDGSTREGWSHLPRVSRTRRECMWRARMVDMTSPSPLQPTAEVEVRVSSRNMALEGGGVTVMIRVSHSVLYLEIPKVCFI